MCAIAPSLQKKLSFLKEYKKNTLPVLPYFNFFPALGESYYVSILFKMSVGDAKLNHNASFKDMDSSKAL